jgi:hypothetical protein
MNKKETPKEPKVVIADVAYDGSQYPELDKVLDGAAQKWGGIGGSAGMGFGLRDIQYEFEAITLEAAQTAADHFVEVIKKECGPALEYASTYSDSWLPFTVTRTYEVSLNQSDLDEQMTDDAEEGYGIVSLAISIAVAMADRGDGYGTIEYQDFVDATGNSPDDYPDTLNESDKWWEGFKVDLATIALQYNAEQTEESQQ